MLWSTSGTRTTPPPHTRDAAPIKSKVAPRITAAQGVDYYSTAWTVPASLHREGHHRRTNRRTVVDTLYVVITVPRSRYTCFLYSSTASYTISSSDTTSRTSSTQWVSLLSHIEAYWHAWNTLISCLWWWKVHFPSNKKCQSLEQ